jgi:hypothetical protein
MRLGGTLAQAQTSSPPRGQGDIESAFEDENRSEHEHRRLETSQHGSSCLRRVVICASASAQRYRWSSFASCS